MIDTSGTYTFQSVQVEPLIRDAYENIGVAPEFITPQKLESARRSINLLLLEWINKSTNLWTLKSMFLQLDKGRDQYTLPKYVSDIVQVNMRSSSRQLSGAASSSSGIANNAFDNNLSTSCSQTAINGNISYDYGEGNAQKINFIGITSNVTKNYNLVIDVSNDGISWSDLQTIKSQTYSQGVTEWFEILTPLESRFYRISEAGDEILDIQEIYLNNNVNDITISNISRDEYFTYPNKKQESRPTNYYLDRAVQPVLYIWPTAAVEFSKPIDTDGTILGCLHISYKKIMQDVGLYTNTLEIPSRFYPALVMGLSFKLALKFNSQMAEILNGEYQNTFNLATMEDSEENTISIRPSWYGNQYVG